jgi:methyl-accepting chemotaxis protein
VRSIIERQTFPRVIGRGVVTVLLGGRSRLTTLMWVNEGDELASPGALRAVAATFEALAKAEGLPLLFEPVCVSGVLTSLPSNAEGIALEDGARCLLIERGEEVKVEAIASIQNVRSTSEAAVLEIGAGLNSLLNSSKKQSLEMNQVVQAFDSGSGGLADTLKALDGEVQHLGSSLRDSLAHHRSEVQGAVGWATDIIALARSVDQIAQSARLLTFNARLESARLGDQGKGFVVIANAIRDLASDVRSSNEVVTRLATSLASTLPRLQRATSDLAETTDTQLGALRSRLSQLQESFKAAHDTTLEALLRTETVAQATRERSHDVIQQLQFQDRCSQLLAHAISEIEVLEETLALEEAQSVRGRAPVSRADDSTPGAVEMF